MRLDLIFRSGKLDALTRVQGKIIVLLLMIGFVGYLLDDNFVHSMC